MKKNLSAKQLVKSNPAKAASILDCLVNLADIQRPAKPELYCVIVGSAVGNSDFIPLTTLNDASAAFRAFCDENGFGARDAGDCQIWQGNKIVAHVSYNGKVWEGETWTRDAKPIFDPYQSCAA